MGDAEPFDIDDRRSRNGSLRFSVREFEEAPLDREAIVASAYLRAVGLAAVARTLPLLEAHPDQRVQEFARTWSEERRRIAEALEAVLAASPQIRGVDVAPLSRAPGHVCLSAAIPGPIALALAVDARVAAHAHRRLGRLSLHPELERLTETMSALLDKHAALFIEHAAGGLGRPLGRRVVAAGVLALLRLPIGESELPDELAREGRELVFGRDDGGLEGIDAGVVSGFALPCTAARRLVHPYRPARLRAAHRLGRLAADTEAAVRGLLDHARQ
ncbi:MULTISPECIES: hypothetical protein [unclassified Rathayibacter]|uniref:hypothetical protein n=1 Tax=unclassified Rathayibacter TaxID=2609250 RepID=UPI00188C91FB|nr:MULTISPECIES: hypothetical protein [unclassified Rathayibacter]MBF4463268.1 hypothetical protein [Rathayibacter sp. VKM Ac-2879]MBF4504495.1 hypothetical protein [Rathayibacter sp. VKM Ac-2878]